MRNLLLSLISVYQKFFSFDHGILALFAPGKACKFEVSCSEYTKQAIESFGIVRGCRLGLKRIWRCR